MLIYEILIFILIIVIKSIFSAADTAFTYINRAEIKQLSKKDKKAWKIRILMENSNKFFGMVEVGLNLSEIAASAFVSLTFLEQFAEILKSVNLSSELSMTISAIFITILLSYFLLVFGALIPKRIARNNPKKVAYKLINILWIITKINYPFEKLINGSIKFFTKLLRIKEEPQEKMTEKQLKMIVREANDEGVVENIEKKILLNTLNSNDVAIKKIVVPIQKVDFINIDSSISDIIKNIKENGYSRMPVYEDKITNIIGIFNIKDIVIKYGREGLQDKKQIMETLRAPQYLDEDEKIFSAFKIMQKNSQMFAIVVDKEKMPIGIVSIENILEKLVGQIFDENDKR